MSIFCPQSFFGICQSSYDFIDSTAVTSSSSQGHKSGYGKVQRMAVFRLRLHHRYGHESEAYCPTVYGLKFEVYLSEF